MKAELENYYYRLQALVFTPIALNSPVQIRKLLFELCNSNRGLGRCFQTEANVHLLRKTRG